MVLRVEEASPFRHVWKVRMGTALLAPMRLTICKCLPVNARKPKTIKLGSPGGRRLFKHFQMNWHLC